jgi:hypothetical protein
MMDMSLAWQHPEVATYFNEVAPLLALFRERAEQAAADYQATQSDEQMRVHVFQLHNVFDAVSKLTAPPLCSTLHNTILHAMLTRVYAYTVLVETHDPDHYAAMADAAEQAILATYDVWNALSGRLTKAVSA